MYLTYLCIVATPKLCVVITQKTKNKQTTTLSFHCDINKPEKMFGTISEWLYF